MSIELYNYLTLYGAVSQTKYKLQDTQKFVKWTEENFTYVKYNPRKEIKRFGLSLTSLDGGLSGVPDLDSLYEYNIENNTKYRERNFVVKTPVYYYKDLEKILEPIKDYIFRSHVLRIDSGGFFPPHRDFFGMNVDSFRLIMPLASCNPPLFSFVIDNNLQYWEDGYLYFVDTAKMHYLFNAGMTSTYMIVLNVDLNEQSVKFVTENFRFK